LFSLIFSSEDSKELSLFSSSFSRDLSSEICRFICSILFSTSEITDSCSCALAGGSDRIRARMKIKPGIASQGKRPFLVLAGADLKANFII
jgi:hypothetical protein